MDIKTTKKIHDADPSFLAHVPKLKTLECKACQSYFMNKKPLEVVKSAC